MTDATQQSPLRKPVVAITMGDPAGIGPEVVVRTLAQRELRRAARFVVYGSNELLTYAADQLEMPPDWYRVQHDSARAGRLISEPVVVLDFDEFDSMLQMPRQASRAGGLISKAFVEEAIHDALRPEDDPRHVDAVVTAPICKASWQMAGFKWPGHTELFAARTRARRSVMAFVAPQLRVALATAHIPLMQVRDCLNIGRVFDPIDLGAEACRMLGIAQPRIAVTGLNPHAGEGGVLGPEEDNVIAPAIEMARTAGIEASGPYPADTVFNRAVAGEFDLVVAMYHDQGLIPVKLLAWESAVNWTLGLPIVRTSPDHGTAFDIAGQNKASAGSTLAATKLAIRLAHHRLNPGQPEPEALAVSPAALPAGKR